MKHRYLILLFTLFSLACFAQSTKDDGKIAGFKLYPNPVTHGKVYISTAKNEPKKIFIFDLFGTQVLQTTLLGKELNLSKLDAGMYVIRVIEKDKVATRKLIVK